MEYFVSPHGLATGDGSQTKPWDLQTAFNHPVIVKPGDTIWLRAGVYGNSVAQFTSHLTGTLAAPIIVRNYQGERATINGGIATWAPYTWYWGIEVTNTDPARLTASPRVECIDTYPGSTGVKIINCILHDGMQGIGLWQDAIDCEVNGNVISNVGKQGQTRGMGHCIYAQNKDGIKLVLDNIWFDAFDIGMQAYGSGAAFVQNIDITGNIAFNNGILAHQHVDNLLLAVGSNLFGMKVTNNWLYHNDGGAVGYNRLGWEFGGRNGDLVSQNNKFMGGGAGGATCLQLWNWDTLTHTDNDHYSSPDQMIALHRLTGQVGQTIDRNTYRGSGLLNIDGGNTGFTAWQGLGYDKAGKVIPGKPTGTSILVRPNKYEPGRAHVAVLNWDHLPTVSVDLSTVLNVGDKYTIQDAQNFYGPALVTGTYDGKPVAISMAPGPKTAPIGLPAQPHTLPEFGVFVVLPIGTIAPIQNTLTAITVSPATITGLVVGGTQQLLATGHYQDGTTADITSQVLWTSTDGSIATVHTSSSPLGLVTGVSSGAVTIKATVGAISASVPVTIGTGIAAISVTVTPNVVTVPAGGTQQFTAVVSQSTNQGVTWTATGGTISASGLFTAGPVVGPFAVTATAAADSTKSVTVAVLVGAVKPPTTAPVSIAVTPATVSIQKGATQQFTAIGTYADKSIADLSGLSAWTTDNGNVATVHATTIPLGLAHGVGAGTCNISATYMGIVGKAALTVAQPIAGGISVSLSPQLPQAKVGDTVQFTALVSGDTAGVTWSTNAPVGLFTASAAGSFTVTATSVTDPTKSASTTILVTTVAVPVQIAITPGVVTLHTGDTANFAALVSGGSGNKAVTWSPNAPGGVYLAGAAGSDTVTVTSVDDPTKSAAAAITILAAAPSATLSVTVAGVTYTATNVPLK